jgi:predicted aldo/keto reductase-like oxidoreductase
MKFDISRRDFFRKSALAALATSPLLTACSGKKDGDTDESQLPQTPIPTDRMTLRVNPSTGDKVSLLGYGCMRWPTKPDFDNPGEDLIDQEEVNRLVDTAIKHGVNYFDTSPAYCKGRSEKAVGIALSRHPRDKYFVATKLSNFDPSTWPREKSEQMYRDSLRLLQTDHIDYMLLHAVGMGNEPLKEFNARYIDNGMLDFLAAEREAGRIRNLGFSYHGDIRLFDMLLEWHDKYKWDFVQIQLNYLDWEHAKEINPRNTNAEYLYGELAKRDIPAIIMEPLLGGRLSKLPDHVVRLLKEQEPQKSVASWAFRYAGTYPKVLTVLSGMTYMDHLEDNLRSFCPLVPLTEEQTGFLHKVAGIIASYPTVPCNECQYCMPCPYGLDIPAIFAHYNKCVNQGQVPDSPEAENYAEARRRFLVGYDRAVPRLRQASHCVGCKECVGHCPQKIDILGEMARVDVIAESLRRGVPPAMSALVALLDKGDTTLVVDNGRVTTYTGRGVSDLHWLLTDHPHMLQGARVADKIVGKGAAALMILGGVRELYTPVISRLALNLLSGYDIKTTYDKVIDHVVNRDKTGWCPVETLCRDLATPKECLAAITEFLNK